MGNCLKTQLKQSVNNPNLVVLGCIRVVTKDVTIITNTKYVTVKSLDGSTFSVNKAGTSVATDVTTYTITNLRTAFQFTSSNAIPLSIENYDFYSIAMVGDINIDDLSYNNGLETININRENASYAPISFKKNMPATLRDVRLYGKIGYNIMQFSGCTSLGIFSVGDTPMGDLVEFAVAQIKAGRTTATISGTYLNRCDFNGISGTSTYYPYTVLKWEPVDSNYKIDLVAGASAGTATVLHTITVDSNGNAV